VPPGQGKRKAARGASAGKRRTLASSPHIPALVLVLALVGWFVYDELSRSPVKHEHDQPPPRPALDAREQSEIDRQQSIVDSNPEDQESLLKLANLLQDHATHNPELLPRAISAYRKYLEANPGAENPRVDLGICLFESAKMDTTRTSQLIHMSLKEMESVFEKNPKHQAAAFNLGIVSLNAGLAVESVEWFRKAAAINPQSDLGKRAQLLLEQHSFTEPVN
jgi:tetratricopeptide (TPR) repeat protein